MIFKDLHHRSTLFRLYYRTNFWGDPKTASGDSSRPERAAAAIEIVQSILDLNQGVRILDIGCGDFSWGSKIRFPPGCQYTGLDIVPEVIEANSRSYGSQPELRFEVSDATSEAFPEADVILIRDLLIHLEDDEIRAVLRSVDLCNPSLLIASSYRGASGTRSLEKWNFAPMDLEDESYGLGTADFFVSEAPEFDRPEDGIKGLAGWQRSTRVKVDFDSIKSGRRRETSVEDKVQRYLPSTRLTGKPSSNWSICSDGRGFAFFSFKAKESAKLQAGEARVRPLYASFSTLDRRLTKKRSCRTDPPVMGHQCIVVVEEVGETCFGFCPGDVCLVRAPVEMNGSSGLPSGYLSDSVVTHCTCLSKISRNKKLYLFLFAYPLSCALAAQPLFQSLEAGGAPLMAAIWGAGTGGLLMTELLRRRGWDVVVSDLFSRESLPSRMATALGATYVQSEFNFEPGFRPLLSIDSSGDPLSTEVALRCTLPQGRVILWPEGTGLPSRYLDDRLTVLKFPNHDFIEDAIQIIENRADDLMDNLVTDIAPLWEFDRALFPRVPNRTAIVKID